MMHRFIHTFKFPLRRWFSRGSSKGMCWLLQRFGADYFWWNGQLLFLFIKDTQLLIILFYWTILPMLPFPLSFGGIWRTKNLTRIRCELVQGLSSFFQSWQTYVSPNSCLLNISSLVIKFREKRKAAASEVSTPSNQLRIWHFPVSTNLINLEASLILSPAR